MLLTHETPRARRIIMAGVWSLVAVLLLLHTFAVRDYMALIDAQGLRGAPTASTPLKQAVPLVYLDAQMWVRYGLDLEERGGARVRFTDVDNAPFGREVHWSSLLTWVIAGAGKLRRVATGEPLPLATERSLPGINFTLLLALAIAFSLWTAHRAGAGAGLLIAFGMIGHRDFYDGFSPYYVDHHGLITAAVFGLVLGAMFMGGGWWKETRADDRTLLPVSRTSARRAAVVSALGGAAGLWLSAASTIPAIVFVSFAGVVTLWIWGKEARSAGATFDAHLWRLWGRVGAAAALGFYLLEYAPTHFGWRMEVNHPLYALAWWGGAELVALVAEWRLGTVPPRPVSPWRWLPPLLAIGAAPAVILLGGAAVFAVRETFVGGISPHVLEGMSLPALVRATGWSIFFLHINESLLPLVPALLLLAVRGTRDRVALGFVVLATACFIALACYQIRFWQNAAGPQLCLTLVVLVALAHDWTARARWWLILGTTTGLFLPPILTRVLDLRETLRHRTVSRLDLAPALHRDIAAALRTSQPTGDIVLLACPSTSTSVSYYGRFKSLGTLYWENHPGLRAAAEIFSARTETEARALLRERHVTHLVFTSDEDFLRPYFDLLHPGATTGDFDRTFGQQLFVRQQIPLWLRVLPYRPPAELQRSGLRVRLLQVVPDQTEAEAFYHLAAAQLADGDVMRAEASLQLAFERTAIAARPDFALKAGNLCYENGARAAAGRLYRSGISLGGNATLATNLAWLLATDPDAAVRHGPDALLLAERIVAARPDDPSSHNVLAAALAENGRFSEAAAAMARAIGLARSLGNTTTVALFEQRLAVYRADRPWRQ